MRNRSVKRNAKSAPKAMPMNPKPARAKAAKEAGDSTALERWHHHKAMADKHRAHADMIEARLRTQGKHIMNSYSDNPTEHKVARRYPKK